MPTTTDNFQVKADYYTDPEKCKKHKNERINTNPRYSRYNQTHFTAGDEEQFETYRDKTNGILLFQEPDLSKNLFKEFSEPVYNKYKNLTSSSVDNTFNYIFHKFKKGIFIKIKNNELKVFLPFSKNNFRNEWWDKISHDPKKFKDIGEFIKFSQEAAGMKYNPKFINYDISSWLGNNSIVRFDDQEGDSKVSSLKNLYETLCKKRQIPDIEFFVNRRDFPIITNNEVEAYDYMFGDDHSLVSHKYSTYSPILSMVSTEKNADIPSPTYEDWNRIKSQDENLFSSDGCGSYNYNFNTDFSSKKPVAIFRGGSTGSGTTVNTNMRLKLVQISRNDGGKSLDAGITKWNVRPRKIKNSKYLQIIDKKNLPKEIIQECSFVTPEEQSNYKYIVNVDGHVSAYRLSLELSMGSVILLQDSKYKTWFRNLIKPYVHYVPIKQDLSNILEQIKWCKENDEKCQEIVKNSLEFYNKYLMEDGILDFLQLTLSTLKKEMGTYIYNYKTPLSFQLENERNELNKNTSYAIKSKVIYQFPVSNVYDNSYYKGVELAFKHTDFSFDDDNGQTIKQSRNSTIKKYTVSGVNITSKHSNNQTETIHGSFIGISINRINCRNFMYTFGTKGTKMYNNYIEGITFQTYLENGFNMDEYLNILSQLSLALYTAQQECGFIHYDLMPWNIIIQKFQEPQTITYRISIDKHVQIKSKLVPVIIDYGKSHVIYKNKHHGIINPYKTSTIQDVLSLLISSISIIINRKNNGQLQRLNYDETSLILFLSNFIKGKFVQNKRFSSIYELKKFINTAKRYSELVFRDKYEMEEKTPLDFYDYITSNNYQTHSKIDTRGKYNPIQILEFSLSKTIQGRVNSYTDVIERIKNCSINPDKNTFFVYYILQEFYHTLTNTYEQLSKFSQKNKKKYDTLFKDTIDTLKNKFIIEDRKEEKILLGTQQVPEYYSYDESIFSNTEKILSSGLLNKDLLKDYSLEKKLVEKVFSDSSIFKLPENLEIFYRENLENLIDCDIFKVISYNAGIFTFKDIVNSVVKNDLNTLKNKPHNDRFIEKILENYKKIYL